MIKFLLITAAIAACFSGTYAAEKPMPMFKVMKTVAPDEDAEIIYDRPEGEQTLYSRDCTGFKSDMFTTEYDKVYGSLMSCVSGEDGLLYFSNPYSEYPVENWFKATPADDGGFTVKGPQPIYQEWNEDDEPVTVYLVPMTLVVDEKDRGTFVAAEDMTMVFNKTDNGYVAADPEMLLGLAQYGELADLDGNPTGETGYAWLGFGDKDIALTARPESNGVTPPEDAEVQNWVWNDTYESALVGVAVDGNDMYIRGLYRNLPDAWVKATIKGDKAVIPSGSYLGPDFSLGFFSYIWGAKVEYSYDPESDEEKPVCVAKDEAVFSYDADNKSLELIDSYVICSMPDIFHQHYIYDKVTVNFQNRNVDTPPAAPYDLAVIPWDEYMGGGKMWFKLPNMDEDGNMLVVDNLYYNVYIDDEIYVFTPDDYFWLEEDMVNVPYDLDNVDFYVMGPDHTAYFYFEIPENCGVQSVYINEEGKELRSRICRNGDTGVTDAAEGLCIRKTTYTDGTVRIEKTIRR